MNTLNIISFDRQIFPDDHHLVTCLNALSVRVCAVQKSAFLTQKQLPTANINLFIFSAMALGDQTCIDSVKHYVLNTPGTINLCLVPHGTKNDARHFFSLFHDFLIWPCSAQELRARIERLLVFKQKNNDDEVRLLEEFTSLNLTGASTLFLQTISLIKKMAACHAAVLIRGETGTGKENAARAIHYLSNRREHGFVPVNCAAIPDELLESELFGHEKGAFTDAKQSQSGLVTIANGGTLFLDEIDSLSPKAQAALLRFLQTQEYRPLGATRTFHADVRILAATNADLKSLVAQKQFREDLYFRLNVLNLTMPALRERASDIPLITECLLKKFAQEYKTPVKKLSFQSMQLLMQQSWPGNIRELENTLLRAFLLSPGDHLQLEQTEPTRQLPQHTDTAWLSSDNEVPVLSFQDAKAQAINQFEASYLRQVMAIANGNVSAAARIAGKERRALGKLLQKYEIDKQQFQPFGRNLIDPQKTHLSPAKISTVAAKSYAFSTAEIATE